MVIYPRSNYWNTISLR